MVLRPLTAHEADALLDPRMRRWQRDLAYRRSGGNPTYLEILAAAALNTGGNIEELPFVLSAPLLGDLHALSPAGRLIARSAAVVGDPSIRICCPRWPRWIRPKRSAASTKMLSNDLIRSAGPFQQFRFRHPLGPPGRLPVGARRLAARRPRPRGGRARSPASRRRPRSRTTSPGRPPPETRPAPRC